MYYPNLFFRNILRYSKIPVRRQSLKSGTGRLPKYGGRSAAGFSRMCVRE